MITLNKEDAFTIVDIISKAQEIVRCKDCKFWKKCIDEDYCSYWEEYCWTPAMEDDFCSRGERRYE